MTRDQIIRMAREAGFSTLLPSEHVNGAGGVYCGDDEISEMLERFAKLVAAAEAAKWVKGAKISVPTMAMEAGFSVYHRRGYEAGKALIPAAVAAEREACATIIQRAGLPSIADAIRARGEG